MPKYSFSCGRRYKGAYKNHLRHRSPHTGFYVEVDGVPVHFLAESPETIDPKTLTALAELARCAIRYIAGNEADNG